MNKVKCLLVGGSRNGTWMDVITPSPPELRLTSLERMAFAPGINDSTVSVSYQSYARHEFMDADRRMHIFYLFGGNQNAPFAELLEAFANTAAALRKKE